MGVDKPWKSWSFICPKTGPFSKMGHAPRPARYKLGPVRPGAGFGGVAPAKEANPPEPTTAAGLRRRPGDLARSRGRRPGPGRGAEVRPELGGRPFATW